MTGDPVDPSLDPLLEGPTPALPSPRRVGVSRQGMIATAHARATEAGVRILEEGGTAVDAAVAAAFALGVCEPAASGLGGQTMLMLRNGETRKTVAIDGSSRAPNRATPEAVQPGDRMRGHRATTVPSTPATLRYVLERYGTLKMKQVLQPAIELAENGFAVTELLHSLMRRKRKAMLGGPAGGVFLTKAGLARPVGSKLKQPALAATLRRLAEKGIRDFYTGRIARAIDADMVRHGGFMRRDDLAQIPRPIERRPLSGRYRETRLLTFPPPAAGRALIEALHIHAGLPKRLSDIDTVDGAVAFAETLRQVFKDRRNRPFDPNYFPQVRNERMLSHDHARETSRRISSRFTLRGETTHLSAMDRKGNVVGLTQSIERVFGACTMSEDLGFLYNNYMSAFEYEDISHPYYLRPNAVPWASVAPTIIFRGRRPWIVIGSPGSERITSAVSQVIIRLRNHTPFEAVDAPRLHASHDGRVSLEASRMRDDIPEALRQKGFEIDEREAYAFFLGCVAMVIQDGKEFMGVADPRRDGSAGGPRK